MTRTNFPPRFPGRAGDTHVCGLYYVIPGSRQYLPQVRLDSHTTINPVCFNNTLKQVFSNTTTNTIAEARYTFPLYDGVAVAGYTITYSGKVLKGVVKQKEVARQTFKAAVARGETAGLLEALPAGIFGTTIGNIPANTEVHVEIQYCGVLIHDAAIDGLRFTLPTSIAPRYGEYPGQVLQSNTSAPGGINITVDLDMGLSSPIRKVQSPTHPIAVTMGATWNSTETAFAPSKASATLTLGSTELAADFVLQLLIDDISKPQAIVEHHPTLPNRAIMATLVPRFNLHPHSPEIVFIADQSGSMQGAKNIALKAALVVFLKSLPLGVRFNICAFGSTFKFLWPKSLAYSEQHLNDALKFVDTLQAQYGGTEMLQPITAAFAQRLGDLPLEIMLLSDGEIWGEQDLFGFINSKIHQEKVDARVFALGIGTDVSSTLIEGVARAGNGFAQFVTQNEETDQKVVRMLKGALYPHTNDYSIEVHYDKRDIKDPEPVDDDYEIIEKVNDCLHIADSSALPPKSKAPVSFFNADANLDEPTKTNTDRYAHLPAIATPKLLQAPSSIPPLFPFNRTSVYLLLSESASLHTISSVTLRASSAQGPLELTIPITARQRGSTVHTLAARKAVQDLKEGRGWLQAAKTSDGKTVKEAHASRFDELVEREAVRLGERYQVAGKWCSFVAVEDKPSDTAKESEVEASPVAPEDPQQNAFGGFGGQVQYQMGAQPSYGALQSSMHMRKMAPSSCFATPSPSAPQASGGALFGSAAQPLSAPFGGRGSSGAFARARSLFRSSHVAPPPPPAQPSMTVDYSRTVVDDTSQAYEAASDDDAQSSDDEMGDGLFDQPQRAPVYFSRGASDSEASDDEEAGSFLGPSEAELEQARLQEAQHMQQQQLRQSQQRAPGAPASVPINVSGDNAALQDFHTQLMLLEQQNKKRLLMARQESDAVTAPALRPPHPAVDVAAIAQYQIEMQSAAAMPMPDEDIKPSAAMASRFRKLAGSGMAKRAAAASAKPAIPQGDVLHAIIALQSFDGFWRWTDELFALLGAQPSYDEQFGSQDLMATALVVAYLETKMGDQKGTWEMIVQKARNWIWFRIVEQPEGSVATGGVGAVDGLIERAAQMLK